jgi:hypothetical protein
VVEWVGIFVPRITQLAAIRTIRFGCRETAGRKSHSFGHGGRCWQLTTVFSTRGLAKTSIAYRCNQECPTEQIDVSHWRSPIDVFRFSRATSLDGLSAICEAGSGPAVRRAAATCRTDAWRENISKPWRARRVDLPTAEWQRHPRAEPERRQRLARRLGYSQQHEATLHGFGEP